MTEKATELVAELKDADLERARAILTAEQEKPEAERRKSVVAAAEARVAELEPVAEVNGTVLEDGAPEDRGWAQLLGDDGEPVLVDGNPVEAELVP